MLFLVELEYVHVGSSLLLEHRNRNILCFSHGTSLPLARTVPNNNTGNWKPFRSQTLLHYFLH